MTVSASRLSLETRDVGRVTVVRLKGRLVSGGESESLRTHITHLLHDRRSIVLHLGEVVFIASSGLGTMVRTPDEHSPGAWRPEVVQCPRARAESPHAVAPDE